MKQRVLAATVKPAWCGAMLMVVASSAYAAVNVTIQWAAGTGAGIPSVVIAFWQFTIALILTLPLLVRDGKRAFRTKHLGLHSIRVVVFAVGVQIWIYALVYVPVWQVVALSMTSPFFVILCARLFLREKVTFGRLITTFTGFVGALIIIAPWSDPYTLYSFLPIFAAALWAGYSVVTKYLTRFENPTCISAYMLVLIWPINAMLWFASGLSMSAINAPRVEIWAILIAVGTLTAVAQYVQTLAYAVADAVYLQPFDDLRLPISVTFSWIVLTTTPNVRFWPGAAMIIGASLYLLRQDSGTTSTANPQDENCILQD